jgi:hypothetical protein
MCLTVWEAKHEAAGVVSRLAAARQLAAMGAWTHVGFFSVHPLLFSQPIN